MSEQHKREAAERMRSSAISVSLYLTCLLGSGINVPPEVLAAADRLLAAAVAATTP